MYKEYQLLDSGNEKKWERWGPYHLIRPASQAVWRPTLEWDHCDGEYTREGKKDWLCDQPLPESWVVEHSGLKFDIRPTDFGHLGLFPEHARFWPKMASWIQGFDASKPPKVLNLFAYTGGATLAAAQAGADVCHLDASKTSTAWAKDNAKLNGLNNASIRWIVDDAVQFVKREIRRGNHYEGIILDPPSFGRGSKGQIFKIEETIGELLDLVCELLSDTPLFLIFTCHTPGMTPLALEHLLKQSMNRKGRVESGEMSIESSLPLPSGSYVQWTVDGID